MKATAAKVCANTSSRLYGLKRNMLDCIRRRQDKLTATKASSSTKVFMGSPQDCNRRSNRSGIVLRRATRNILLRNSPGLRSSRSACRDRGSTGSMACFVTAGFRNVGFEAWKSRLGLVWF